MILEIVVPALNAEATIGQCLDALGRAGAGAGDVIVIDDASADATAAIARRHGARVVSSARPAGAGRSRNLGAASCYGDVVVFVDADVCVAPDALDRIAAVLSGDPDLAAVFGSYDDAPAAPGTISRIRNLLHHHVHQRGEREATSFWTGLGAVRRAAFERVGGFASDQRMMEDIRFGHDLWRAGLRIELRPEIQGTHLKRWTLPSMLRMDLLDRAIPWSRLLLRSPAGSPPPRLNVSATGKLSVCLVGASVLALLALPAAALLAAPMPAVAALVIAILALVLGLAAANLPFLRLVRRRMGLPAAWAALFVLWAHYGMSGLGYLWVVLELLGAGPVRKARA